MKWELKAEIQIHGRPFILNKEPDLAKIYSYFDEFGTHFSIVYKDISTWAYDDSSLFSPDWGDCILFTNPEEVSVEKYVEYYLNTDEGYTHDEGGESISIRLSYKNVKIEILKKYYK